MTVRVIAEARASSILHGLAAGLRREDREGLWLAPANVCVAVPLALLTAGVDVEFVDIDPTSLNMDPDLVAAAAKGRPIAGIVYVRTYGAEPSASVDLGDLRRIAEADAVIVDDRCLCDPETTADGVLPEADVTLFSTGYGKPLDLGGGGHAFVRGDLPYTPSHAHHDPEAYGRLEAMCRIAAAGSPLADGDRRRQRELLAGHSWMPPSGATVWPSLKQGIDAGLPAARARRERINDIYAAALDGLGALGPDFRAWRFNLLAGNSGELIERIFDEGLFASRHYAPATRIFGGQPAPVAERLARQVVNLFNDRHFDEGRAARVARIVTSWYRPPETAGEAN